MRFVQKRAALLAVLLSLAGVAACENQLPTLTGDGAFPADRIPVTLELTLPMEQVLVSQAVYDGFDTRLEYLLVANGFDGALHAHSLARFAGYPDSVRYMVGGAPRTEADFAYTGGRVIAVVDTLSSLRQPTRLEVHAITQFWDTLAVSWQNAVNRPGATVPWSTPGGTVGPAIGGADWAGAGGQSDTLALQLDSLTVRRLARGELHGVQIRAATPGARVELSRLQLEVSIRPAGRPDTTVTHLVLGGRQTFVLTPDPPEPAGILRIGGLTGARAALQLNADVQVPTCAPPQTGPACPMVSLREVTLDRAALVLRPAPVAGGHRPLTATVVQARRLLEPELGRRAPVGPLLTTQNVPADRFAGGADNDVTIDLTAPLMGALATTPRRLSIVLVSPIGANDFGTLWFQPSPTFRLIYTVTRPPQLP
jgi:hypothetical protein